MAFQGYLLAFNGYQLDNKYISFKSYKVHPNQRLEIKAFRDANGLLHRVTVPHYKTKIEIETIGGLNNEKKQTIFNTINYEGRSSEDRVQRRYSITYWNDENNNYETGVFYMTDPEITIRRVTDKDIIYEPIKLTFIQY